MNALRSLFTLLFVVIAAVCVVMLLNITAPNPTGRRYSSASPLTRTIGGTYKAIGASGERILSADLGVPNNNQADQRQCICQNGLGAPRNQCNTCFAHAPISSPGGFRIPDFVTGRYIAESKNRERLLYSFTDQVEQISDYATAARFVGLPLWIFVRVDTVMSDEFTRLAESTGGGVVRYFSVPDYVDSVDQAARIGLLISVSGLIVLVITGAVRRSSTLKPRQHPIESAEQFVAEAKARYQAESDKEDMRPPFV